MTRPRDRCGPVKSDLFKEILAKFSALAVMLQSSRKAHKDKESGEGKDREIKEAKDLKVRRGGRGTG